MPQLVASTGNSIRWTLSTWFLLIVLVLGTVAIRAASPGSTALAHSGASTPPATMQSARERPPAWSILAREPRIFEALSLAHARAEAWRPLAQVAPRRAVRVDWGVLPEGLHASTRVDDEDGIAVTLNPSLQGESPAALAAVLAHEVSHTVDSDRTWSLKGCLQDEIDAFAWGAYVWREVSASR